MPQGRIRTAERSRKRKRETRLRRTPRYATHGESVVPVVVVLRVDVGTVEVQVASVGITVDCTRPVVAVATCVVKRATIHVAATDKIQQRHVALKSVTQVANATTRPWARLVIWTLLRE